MPATPEQRAQAVADAHELVESGLSANKAADQVAANYGVTRRSIQSWAHKTGKPLGDAAHEGSNRAREAAEVQFEARRAELRVLLSEKVVDIIGRMDKPHIDFRGKEAEEVVFPIATSTDVRNYAVAAGILIDKMRLEEGQHTTHGITESKDVDDFDLEVRRLLVIAESEARNRVPAE